MATVTIYLRGDQIAQYSSFSGTGNGADRVVTVNDVAAIGTADDIFTVVIEQVNDGVTEFQNGQFITILDAQGAVVVPRTSVQPDIEQGLGAGDEHLLLSGQPFLIDLGGVPVGPETVTYTIDDEVASAGGDDDGNLDFPDFPCFGAGTMIRTPAGQADVADLAPGDLVETRDHGPVPILWVGQRALDLPPGGAGKPVLIKAGSFGARQPGADMVVSPDHRILVSDPACALLFGVTEVLAPAKGLLGLPRVREMCGKKRVVYVTLLTRRHEVICANDLPVETLYPGPQALRRLGPLGRAEILSLFPRLRTESAAAAFPPARRFLTMKEAQALSELLRLRQRLNGDMALSEAARQLRLVK